MASGRRYNLGMQDRTLYARLLGIEEPWRVIDVALRLDEAQEVLVSVELDSGAALHCPVRRQNILDKDGSLLRDSSGF